MERRKFVKQCCIGSLAIPIGSSILTSCVGMHYATATEKGNIISIPKSEFVILNPKGNKQRKFVLVKSSRFSFPIGIVPNGNHYTASLMKCTHRGCELNIGGGIYSCPCHGSEFTLEGQVLQGPAIDALTTFEIETDDDTIYIKL
tara:strand:- start:440203 stop:440637 length:435 start_codon:yes stop_codon:yes gene_type:complete